MAPRSLSAAFFGSFSATYLLAGNVVDFKHAYCESSFGGIQAFNAVKEPCQPELRQLQTSAEMVDRVLSWQNLDVLVVAGFAYRLPIEVIQRFKWVINMHPGDLFTNRGATPMATDILQKNPFLTVSIHLIDSERLDAGPLISLTRFPTRYDKNYLFNQSLADQHGGLLLIEVLNRLKAGQDVGAMPWVPKAGSYQPRVPADILNSMVNAPTLQDYLVNEKHLSAVY